MGPFEYLQQPSSRLHNYDSHVNLVNRAVNSSFLLPFISFIHPPPSTLPSFIHSSSIHPSFIHSFFSIHPSFIHSFISFTLLSFIHPPPSTLPSFIHSSPSTLPSFIHSSLSPFLHSFIFSFFILFQSFIVQLFNHSSISSLISVFIFQ